MNRPRLVRLLFWIAVIFAFVMALVPQPPQLPGHPSDKVQHVLAFSTLALLGAWAYPLAAAAPMLLRLSLFGALIELAQAIPALHRDSDFQDWIADTAAAAAVLLFAAWLRQRRAGPR